VNKTTTCGIAYLHHLLALAYGCHTLYHAGALVLAEFVLLSIVYYYAFGYKV
jgi:hypothetical protein